MSRRILPSGDVAWYYCMPDDINECKGKPSAWVNVRWSGVLEKRDSGPGVCGRIETLKKSCVYRKQK